MLRRNAFGMSEVLAVVLLFALLAAVLVPVLNRQRDFKFSPCQANLRDISLGILIYKEDYDGYMPRIKVSPADVVNPHGAFYGWADALSSYTKSPQVFQCPSEKSSPGPNPIAWKKGYTDYYLNDLLSGHTTGYLKHPERTVMLGEGNDGSDATDSRYAYAKIPARWENDKASPLYRHGGYANYAFVDGHIKRLKFPRPGNHPAWLGSFTFHS